MAGRLVSGLLATALILGGWLAVRSLAHPSGPGDAEELRLAPQSAPKQVAPSRPRERQPTVAASPCRSNTRQQLIVVSIRKQHLWACSAKHPVLSTPVTTGRTNHTGDATPRGHFAVQGIERHITLTTDGPRSYPVRFWIPFHLGVWGFHDASWQTIPFGSRHYRSHGSHGCVHMPLAAIRTLYHWVHYGTVVRIH